MVEGCSGAQAVAVLQHIRACNAEALTANNGVNLQRLYGQLMEYFSEVAGKHPLCWEVLDALAPLLQTMTGEVPWYAATFARSRLQAIHRHFGKSMASPKYVPVQAHVLLL
jgi:nucleolar protein 14